MKIYLDKKINEWWYKKPGLIACMLSPLSWIYQGISYLRSLLFKLNWIAVYESSVPVIVVGNLSVGGVGKTPVVAAIARHFMQQGKTVGVVSRGYGGKAKTWPQVVTADSDPCLVGDEPVMLAQQLGCCVVVSPKRVDAIKVCEKVGCDIVISDDGLTHYYFKRTAECIVIDGERQLGNGFCLPVGPLRESKERLKKADLILFQTKNACDEKHWHLNPVEYVSLNSLNETYPLTAFENKKIHAVSAIGNNKRFFNTLRNLKCDCYEHPYPDHYSLSDVELSFRDLLPVVMTEKDSVKYRNFKGKNDYLFLRVEAALHPSVYEKLNNLIM